MNEKPITLRAIISEFNNDAKARELIEGIRWPNGPVCVHCGHDKAYTIKGKAESTNPAKAGTYKCAKCRKKFNVCMGTILEKSHISLGNWLVATILMCSSKKGISAKQIQRLLGLSSYQTAWFMCHRIRHGMTEATETKLSGIVEADETYVGGKPRKGKSAEMQVNSGIRYSYGRGTHKSPVFALVQRDGKARARVFPNVTAANLRTEFAHVDKSATLYTDDFKVYRGIGRDFAKHEHTMHKIGQYSKGDGIHSNTVECFFSLLKRGIYGQFHNVSKKHLQRYVDEAVFKWNYRKGSDGERFKTAVKLFEGKRLQYQRPD